MDLSDAWVNVMALVESVVSGDERNRRTAHLKTDSVSVNTLNLK